MDGNLRGGFDMTDDKNAVQASQAMHFTQSVEHEILIGLHVARMHFDEEIKLCVVINVLTDVNG